MPVLIKNQETENPLLEAILRPLEKHYGDPATIEIRMGQPGAVVVDRRGCPKAIIEDGDLSLGCIEAICKSIANFKGIAFDPDLKPKLSAILPGGHRFECLVGSSVQTSLSLAIRCKHPFTPSWDQLAVDDELKGYLLEAVDQSKNIIVSGSTNTGKTTLLNMLLTSLPKDRRVIAVEDTPELEIARFWDSVGLLAEREEGNEDSGMVSWRELYDHILRITPDHILFGEISTQNAYAALAAMNAGFTGFMCTIHAESPLHAIERKFDQNIAWAGSEMRDVKGYLRSLIDVVIQIKRDRDGWRRVTDVYEPKTGRWVLKA